MSDSVGREIKIGDTTFVVTDIRLHEDRDIKKVILEPQQIKDNQDVKEIPLA